MNHRKRQELNEEGEESSMSWEVLSSSMRTIGSRPGQKACPNNNDCYSAKVYRVRRPSNGPIRPPYAFRWGGAA